MNANIGVHSGGYKHGFWSHAQCFYNRLSIASIYISINRYFVIDAPGSPVILAAMMRTTTLTENDLRRAISELSKLLECGDATERDAKRLQELRRQLDVIEDAKSDKRRWR